MAHLVIKLGALGDFVQATTAFKAIRLAHPSDKLFLLTTAPYIDFAKRLGFFDDVWIDKKPSIFNLKKLFDFRKHISGYSIDTVYDLQGVDRTQMYKWVLKGVYKQWVGFSNNMAHIHPQNRFETLFAMHDVANFSNALNLSFIGTDLYALELLKPYVLMVPGASMAHNGAKKWPEENFAKLACLIAQNEMDVVIVGGVDENFSKITAQCPFVKNLTGKTSFYDVIGLGKRATLTIGNDTGPTLLAASGGAPTVTFFSKHNPPNKGGALGVNHHQIYKSDLSTLEVDEVWNKVKPFIIL